MPKPNLELLNPQNYPHNIEIPTRFVDLNVGNHVSNIALIQMFEDARARLLFQFGVEIVNPEFVLMIVGNKIDYLAECFWPAPVIIYNNVAKIGNASFEINQLAIQDNKPVCICTLTMVNTKNGKATPLSENLKSKLETLK